MPNGSTHVAATSGKNGNERYCFLHIRKTGGTSLTRYLETRFERGAILTGCPLALAKSEGIEALTPYRLFTGDINYRVWDELPFRPIFMTLLRHPIERIESEYWFLRSANSNHPYLVKNPASEIAMQVQLAKAMSLMEFVSSEHDALEGQVANSQARQLTCGVDVRFTGTDDEPLEMAKAHLREFEFVGITEQFNLSLILLTKTFDWPLPDREWRENTYEAVQQTVGNVPMQRPSTLPADVVKVIWERNQVDVQLYTYARQLFTDRAAALW